MTTQNTTPQADQNVSDTGAEQANDGAHVNEARHLYDQALEHHRAGRLDAAIKAYARVLHIAPNAPDVYNNLGVALRAAGRPQAAVACYRRSLGIRPGAANVYTNLGNALRDMDETAKAVEAHRRAVKHGPKSPKALYNAGLAFREGGHTKSALEHFNRAVKLEPTYAQCRVEHAITLLQMGDWQRGFKELEIRFALQGLDSRRKNIEVWNGSPLQGRTILINYEADEGLTVQFVRFAAALKRGGARVIMECPAHLAPLLSGSPDVDATVEPGGDVSGIDVQIPLLSLPARLGTTIDTVPEETPYLNVPTAGVTALDIHPETRLAIGLAWSGRWEGRSNPAAKRHGDMRLDDMAELAGVPNVQLFSLERGAGASDIARLGLQPLIKPVGQNLMNLGQMAAVIDQLDLVICTDSVTAHIAGALGKPVWMLLDTGAAWCWLEEREDSPWYPSMRLFRRLPDQDWAPVVSSVRQALMDVLKGA